MSKTDDKILVQQTLNGDKNAFGELVDRYKGAVFGLAFNRVKDFEDAKDIAQEAFIEAYLKLETLREHSKFSNWLYTITVNLCRMWLRRKSKRALGLDELDWIEEIPGQRKILPPPLSHWQPKTPEEEYTEKQLRESILTAIDSLPPKCRETVVLYYMDGLSYRDIADFLALPVSTVRGRLEYGRKKLKEEMITMIEETLKREAPMEEFVKKVLEGVEKLQWGKGQENTFIGALTAAMRAIGEDVTYDYLMGVSGAAFRLHFHQPNWCPSSPDAGCGFDCTEIAIKALGYTAEGHWTPKDKPEAVKKTREAIVQSINKGFPVVAIDLINGAPDYGVIVGYSDGGKKFLCRTYEDKTEGYSQAEKWPWVVLVIKEKGKVPDRRENLLRSLEIAVELANTDRYPGHAEKTFYASGFGAYETWAANLLDESRFENLDEKKLRFMTQTNGWCYSSLVDVREAAMKYLRSIEGEFEEQSAVHLSMAADIYKEVVEKLKDGWKYAPLPWKLKEGEYWTKEMRHAEAGVLKEALALERKAVDELKAALELVG